MDAGHVIRHEPEHDMSRWEKIPVDDDNRWAHFRGKVWHMTWPEPALMILGDEEILPSSKI